MNTLAEPEKVNLTDIVSRLIGTGGQTQWAGGTSEKKPANTRVISLSQKVATSSGVILHNNLATAKIN